MSRIRVCLVVKHSHIGRILKGTIRKDMEETDNIPVINVILRLIGKKLCQDTQKLGMLDPE